MYVEHIQMEFQPFDLLHDKINIQQLQLQKPYIISGRSGGNISSIIGSNSYEGKILTEIKYILPNYVMIMIGTNGGGTSQQYKDMCNRITALGCKVLLNNIPCHNNDGTEVAGATNTIIESVRNELGLNGVLMNVATSLNNDGTNINASLFNSGTNKIHPNAQGNKAMYLRTFQDVPELYTDADVIPINTLNLT
jgi:lysophospholipase L1-like esterase